MEPNNSPTSQNLSNKINPIPNSTNASPNPIPKKIPLKSVALPKKICLSPTNIKFDQENNKYIVKAKQRVKNIKTPPKIVKRKNSNPNSEIFGSFLISTSMRASSPSSFEGKNALNSKDESPEIIGRLDGENMPKIIDPNLKRTSPKLLEGRAIQKGNLPNMNNRGNENQSTRNNNFLKESPINNKIEKPHIDNNTKASNTNLEIDTNGTSNPSNPVPKTRYFTINNNSNLKLSANLSDNNNWGSLEKDFENKKQEGEKFFFGRFRHHTPTPQDFVSLKGVNLVACGEKHFLFTAEKKIWSFGKGDHGQLGHSNTTTISTPKMIEKLKDNLITHISAGGNTSGAIDNQNKLYLWYFLKKKKEKIFQKKKKKKGR